MNKRILTSLAVIFAVAAIATGATVALFTDTKTITGNTFATGVLKLTLNKSAGKPFNVSNAYPGYSTGWEYMDIFNNAANSTLPFEAYMTVSQTGGDATLWNWLKIEMKTSGGNSDCNDGDAGEGTIYSGWINNFPVKKLVSSANYWHLANEDDGSGSPADNIRVGYSERVCQRVWLPLSADNSVMGKSVTFDEIVDAMSDND